MLVSAVGVFTFAFVVGSATSSLAASDAMALHQRNRVETIQHYMRYRRVPMKLQRQVNEYFAYLYTCMRGLGESDVMASLPSSLRRQLAIALNRKLFLKVELFRRCPPNAILALAEQLTPTIAMPNEYVLRQGDPVEAIHFLSRGRVLVLVAMHGGASDSALYGASDGGNHGGSGSAPNSRSGSPLAARRRVDAPLADVVGGGGGGGGGRCQQLAAAPLSPQPPQSRRKSVAYMRRAPSAASAVAFAASATASCSRTASSRSLLSSARVLSRGSSAQSDISSTSTISSSSATASAGPAHQGGRRGEKRRMGICAKVAPATPQSYRIVNHLGEYDTFGEECFITRSPSNVSVRASTFCDMMLLYSSAFEQVSRQFPGLAELVDKQKKSKVEPTSRGQELRAKLKRASLQVAFGLSMSQQKADARVEAAGTSTPSTTS